MSDMKPICIGCGRHPAEIEEYREAIRAEPDIWDDEDDYVRDQEGTYNPVNGHFCCDRCYVAMGCPSSPDGWVAP